MTRIAFILGRMWLWFVSPRTALQGTSPRLRTAIAKGPTFIEYALMVVIILGIAIAISDAMTGWIQHLISNITTHITGAHVTKAGGIS